MDEVLFGVLAENVGRYLDAVDRRMGVDAGAGHGHGQSGQPSEELRLLVAAWRALLDLHRPAGRKGRCGGCAQGCRGTTMCNVWRVANAFFIRGAGP